MKKEITASSYNIFPIGQYNKNQGKNIISIYKAYKPALKNLELFSHIIFFYKGTNRTDIKSLKDINDTDNICISVSRIVQIDVNSGIIEIDYSDADESCYVFDIKPYFPSEDRVKEPIVPDVIKRLSEWRPDPDTQEQVITKYSTFSEDDDKQEFNLQQIGLIKKIDGDYYLDLKGINNDIFKKLDGFSHIQIIWWFNRFDNKTYRKITQCDPPYENAPRTGVFASRSPVRPNPIAMTTAQVLAIDSQKATIRVTGLDSFDKTPIIDIKPYIPAKDRVREFYVPEWVSHWPEWLEDNSINENKVDVHIISPDIEKLRRFASIKNEDLSKDGVFASEQITYEKNDTEIVVKGARQNNLKNITLSIPKNKITVITGVSGSGKSSLAFDTLYAESQRRFMDSISSGRSLYEQMEKPDVEQITGLPPAIAVEQKSISRNPRSTVGTITDLYDYLRLLFSKIGIRHCPDCGRAICPISSDEIINALRMLKPGNELSIRGFNHNEGLLNMKVPDNDTTGIYKKSISQSVGKGLEIGNGAIEIIINRNETIVLQTKQMCYHCNRIFFELSSSTFSYNNPEGMCPVCNGLGKKLEVDPELIISKPYLSILDGASEWWGNLRKHREKPNANWMKGEVLALAEQMDVDLELPWSELPEVFKHQVLYGSQGKEVRFLYENTNGRKGEIVRPVEGVVNCMSRLFKENSGETAARLSETFMREKPCDLCRGEKLSPIGRLVTVGGTRFPEAAAMSIEELYNWVKNIPAKLTKEERLICGQILNTLKQRLENLIDVGLKYLALDRTAPTLSGGEAQRLRLAAQLGCGLTNLLYILDEPSIGLHPKDQEALLNAIKNLRDEGNTVVIVEHDPEIMLAADRIIDIGPGAGEYGGEVIAQGTPQDIINSPTSETGMFLRGDKVIGSSNKIKKAPEEFITIFEARHNNLKNIDVSFPIGMLTCITGVSGSGKSSLISGTLSPALGRFLNTSNDIPGEYTRLEGAEKIDKVINISQQPIGRSPRSNPATYTGMFDDIRDLFVSTADAREKGYKQNRFSFNSKEGQCKACGGEGRKCIQMHFMPDIWVECSVCHGKRFDEETLQIKYNGKSISDVLEMDVDEAFEFFSDASKIKRILQTLHDVGLGYIKLGQSALTLSGGEAQRIKLAKELSRPDTGKTLYILDEPTTGLHFSDIESLMKILHRITTAGNSAIVIEHNTDVIKNANWIIDMGPEGGDLGGYVIVQGTPEQVAESRNSYTGKVLRSLMR